MRNPVCRAVPETPQNQNPRLLRVGFCRERAGMEMLQDLFLLCWMTTESSVRASKR